MEDLIPIDIYKEPLKKVEGGFGYLGCILQSKDESKIQCHICGELHYNLALHIRKHKISATEYKDRFQLMHKTKLISRVCRDEARMRFMKNFSFEERKAMQAEGLKRLLANPHRTTQGKKETLEMKNKKGSCPDQIIEKIKSVATELGHTPAIAEFVASTDGEKYLRYIRRTFKTFHNALKIANLTPKEIKPSKFTVWKYNPETLKEFLNIFSREENRIPRYSDLGTGILPHYTTYARHFGTLEKARQESGIYDLF